MGHRQRGRTIPVDPENGELRSEWFTVETDEGVAVGGLDNVFDFEDEESALRVVQNLVAEVGKPLTVVGYSRVTLGTYAAVTKIERVDSD